MALLWDGGVRAGRIDPRRFVEVTASATARIFVMSRGEVIVDHGEWKGRPGRREFLKRAHAHLA